MGLSFHDNIQSPDSLREVPATNMIHGKGIRNFDTIICMFLAVLTELKSVCVMSLFHSFSRGSHNVSVGDISILRLSLQSLSIVQPEDILHAYERSRLIIT